VFVGAAHDLRLTVLQAAPIGGSRGPFFFEESTMNWDNIQGSWKQFTGKVKEKWGKLTDDDLTVVAGKKDQLAGLLQQRYGYAKDEAQRQIDEFAKNLK
jgi:uncharacterized protein YjbJ (UPF0337 family)